MSQQTVSEWQAFLETHRAGMELLGRIPLGMTEPIIHPEHFLDLIVRGDCEETR